MVSLIHISTPFASTSLRESHVTQAVTYTERGLKSFIFSLHSLILTQAHCFIHDFITLSHPEPRTGHASRLRSHTQEADLYQLASELGSLVRTQAHSPTDNFIVP